ncbi:coiled-coil domain-containing protein 194 isoform X2 [Cricetulus griseus]|uniref:Coiled-coil domain-containing protein 194 isoform X2 n=1 Tax=Cricetulus griseus TaxID=10029 RepID=A0A9J7H945_CRIGR|nr:coiled-coil domain-containing protein 194 isoform X2 [Cricetulus griseus]
MAEPGPEPGRAWRLLALCGAAVFLAAAAAGGALVAWNLAASTARGPRCPEPEQVNATLWPPDSAPEVEELRRRLAEAEQLHESLAAQLQRAKGDKRELEVAFKACKDRQSRLQTQLKTLKIEMDEAKAQGTQMGLENGELTEALARWEAAAVESRQQLEAALQRVGAAEAAGEACAGREAALKERIDALETDLGNLQRLSRPRPRSGSRSKPSIRSRPRSGPTKGCRRPPRDPQ